ncbi:MAG: L,D-transpeptidase family protein [Pyrinomonadaceae bacterium]
MRKILILLVVIILTSAFFASKRLIMNSENKIEPESEQKLIPAKIPQTDFETENIELPEMKNPRIVVKKIMRKLEVFDGDKLIKTYRVGLGFAPVGDKERQGDGKTPEGEFFIFTKNDQSKFYLSIGVSYPSMDDAGRGLRENLISKKQHDEIVEAIKNKKMPLQNTKLGGEIYIHGNGSSSDWTLGCVALEDAEMKELFDAVPIGTSIKIEP